MAAESETPRNPELAGRHAESDRNISVPNVLGMTQEKAQAELNKANLKFGTVTTVSSYTTAGSVMGTNPPPGTRVSPGSQVTLEVSAAAPAAAAPANLTTKFVNGFIELLPSISVVLITLLGLGLVAFIAWGMFDVKLGFLQSLGNQAIARGLITFLIAITTVGVAIILALSTVTGNGKNPEEDAKRFDRGKQVLTALIGVVVAMGVGPP